MPLILGTNSIKDTGFDVANSLRFNSGSSDSLTRSTTAGNRTTWTFSTWFKRSKLGVLQSILEHDDANYFRIRITSGDVFEVFDSNGNNTWNWHGVLRDTSSWYSIILRGDSTDGTNGNRLRLYINGTLASANTVASISQNYTFSFNQGGTLQIGKRGSTDYLDGYLAETILIDGSALEPDQFGEFDSATAIWKPIDVSGLTFGNEGLYLDFQNSGSLGADVSGNGNNFTVNNLTAIDQSTDTCTNNFATMNPLDLGATTGGEFLQGNLDVHMGGTAQGVYYSTIGVSTGKWYVEVNPDSGSGGNSYIGISGNANNSRGANDLLGDLAFDYGYYQSDGSLRNNDSDSSYGSSYSNGNIIGVYLDLDNNKLYFSVNGTVQNSGTGISISAVTNTPTGNYFFCVGDDNAFAERRFNLNFGSPIESISSSNTDDNGYGNFEYSPNITGDSVAKKFYSLNTKNLAEYG